MRRAGKTDMWRVKDTINSSKWIHFGQRINFFFFLLRAFSKKRKEEEKRASVLSAFVVETRSFEIFPGKILVSMLSRSLFLLLFLFSFIIKIKTSRRDRYKIQNTQFKRRREISFQRISKTVSKFQLFLKRTDKFF